MVHHMDKNHLVEVLGSFASNMFTQKFARKILSHGVCYQYVPGYVMRFSMNFGCKTFLPLNFLEFVGDGIGMPM